MKKEAAALPVHLTDWFNQPAAHLLSRDVGARDEAVPMLPCSPEKLFALFFSLYNRSELCE